VIDGARPLRVTYLINSYPLVSTTFIRREILALERRGLEIQRIALRGLGTAVMDEQDDREQARTRYVLTDGLAPLLWALVRTMLTSPWRFASALSLAVRLGWRADRPLPFHLAYLAEACRVLPWTKSFGATHLHAHFGTNAAEVAMLVRVLGGPPYSFTVHGPLEFDKPEFLAIAEKVRRSAFVAVISSFGRSQLYRWIEHAQWPKVKIVHGGVESAFYDAAPVSPAPDPRLVCVGRLSAEKGQLLLVEAARRIAAKGIRFDLVLVGGGEMRAEIESLVARHGLRDRVRVTGAISTDQLRDEIQLARALVLASFAEGLPSVIFEAMALRRPVLSTHIAGIAELILPGKNGWLYPPGSIEALVEAIEDCLSRSSEELRAMGEAARERALELHSIDVEAGKLAEYFCGRSDGRA